MPFLYDRENSFEGKYLHDKELEFKIKSRRNYLFGLWVAKQKNLNEIESKNYAHFLIDMLVQDPRDDTILEKALEDLKDIKHPFTLLQLRKQLDYAFEDARAQLTRQLP